MTSSCLSSTILFILSVIGYGIHPLQQKLLSPQLFSSNETTFLEVGIKGVGTWIDQYIGDLHGPARLSLKGICDQQISRIYVWDQLATKPVAKYFTKESKTLPSIYLQMEASSEWYRLRLQHDDGPTISGPHFVESYCAPLKATINLLVDRLHPRSAANPPTRHEIDTWVHEIGQSLRKSYACEDEYHLEVFYAALPTDALTMVLGGNGASYHISGGVLRAITEHNGDVLSYKGGKPKRKKDINLQDAINLIRYFWKDVRVITPNTGAPEAPVIAAVAAKLKPYCSLGAGRAPLPYVRNFDDEYTYLHH